MRLAHRRRLYVAPSLVEDGIVIDHLECFFFSLFLCVSSSRSPPLRISWLRLNPRCALELHTIRGMVREADDMDRGLDSALQRTQARMMDYADVPLAPQPRPQSSSAAATVLFAQSIPPTAPLPTAPVSHSACRALAASTQKEFIPSACVNIYPRSLSIPTPQAVTPSIAAPSSTKANTVQTPTPAHTIVSTPTSSTIAGANGSMKRTHEDDTDAPTPGFTFALLESLPPSSVSFSPFFRSLACLPALPILTHSYQKTCTVYNPLSISGI